MGLIDKNKSGFRNFKMEQTDENELISNLVREFIPKDAEFIVDVGAGLGDIAANSFPDTEALLIDIADFPENGCAKHRRETIDFFDHRFRGKGGGLMLFSHVLQYLDDDIPALLAKVREFDPRYILVVCDKTDNLQRDIFEWYSSNGVDFNPETPIEAFPGESFIRTKHMEFVGKVEASDFASLSDTLSQFIFDASIPLLKRRKFGNWLVSKLERPLIEIPQTIELYERKMG